MAISQYDEITADNIVKELNSKINTSDILNSETLNIIKTQYCYIPDNCAVGDTVILDGIECRCVDTGVTIQGSDLTRIAVDKNYDLGYYQKYVGITQGGTEISQIRQWRWGGYGTELGNTSKEIGYGLQNTINCLANLVNYTKGTYTETNYDGYPLLWQGVNDFRASHSDKWFVPSANELKKYLWGYIGLKFDTATGGDYYYSYWSSTEGTAKRVYTINPYSSESSLGASNKYSYSCVRLCRAF